MIIIKAGVSAKNSGFRLFLMTLPFLIAVFVFSYLPLYGWIYSFFDYRAGLKLSDCNFVGLKHFLAIVNNPVSSADIIRVMRNTFAMSFLGILISPLPALFAIFLMEIKSKALQRVIQTLTTIPNFISWILVYSVVWAIFSVGDGFVNRLLLTLNIVDTEINFI